MENEKICIIGGGPTGVGLGKCFKEAGLAFDIIEREKDFGGLWGFEYDSGRVYASTHLISSRKNTQFSDYPMPKDYPDYPNHKLVLKYFHDIANHYDLYPHATFNTAVVGMEKAGDHWQIKLSNGETRKYRIVVIGTGRLSIPITPQFPGHFAGETIHSSEYKNPDALRNKRVLVLGGGNSGCDIAIDSVHFAAKTILSIRRGYHFMPKYIYGKPTQDWLMEIGSQFNSTKELWDYVESVFDAAGYNCVDFGFPKPDHSIDAAHPIINSQVLFHKGQGDIILKPNIKMLKENSVEFEDGSEEEVDIIINATGYEPDFSYLPDEVGVKTADDLHDLFMYTFHRDIDNLLFAGFINTASGLGNLVNSIGQLLVNYINALNRKAPVLETFNQVKKGPNPDFGQDRFVKTRRHKLEVDLWKYIKANNALSTKLKG